MTMAESIRQPDELVLSGNIAENCRKQEFELYMLAADYDEKPSRQKIALLLQVAVNKRSKYTIHLLSLKKRKECIRVL